MPSIFSKIVAGEIPSYKIAEDDRFYAFLDINPIQPGHTLVIPKREVDYIFDLSEEESGALFMFAHRIAIAIRQVVPCKRVGVAVLGMEVPHAHIHLIPLTHERDLDFSKPRCSIASDTFQKLALQIAQALNP
ncbi:MAG: HIT family protein [Bacteroidales bacterium]|nr:HIT family protein [Bacteroidales bacterium]